jgi:recombination protein RecA
VQALDKGGAEVDYLFLANKKRILQAPLYLAFPPSWSQECVCMPIGQRAAALRLQVEMALAGRVVAPLEYRDRSVVEAVSTGIAEIDELTGGLPRGCLTEIFGEAGSGRTSLLLAALAARTREGEVCALVDGRDAFDPVAGVAAGVRLRQLLWVRCKNIEQALRATDLLIQGGGFGLIALDLSDVAPRVVRQVQLSVWFRFRRAVENTPTILFLLGQESHAKTCASLVLRMEGEAGVWRETSREMSHALGPVAQPILALRPSPEPGGDDHARRKSSSENEMVRKNNAHAAGCLLEGAKNWAEVVRSRMQTEDARTRGNRVTADRSMTDRVLSIDAWKMDGKRINSTRFAIKTEWNYLHGERD